MLQEMCSKGRDNRRGKVVGMQARLIVVFPRRRRGNHAIFLVMTTVLLDEESAKVLEKLRQQAAAQGISFDRYLSALAANSTSGVIARSPHDLTPAEFREWLRDMSAGLPPLPPIPPGFSRADLYNDHD